MFGSIMLSYPIILAHGIYPFHFLFPPFLCKDNTANDGFHYFRGIRSALIGAGFKVFHSRVSWGGRLDQRANQLRDEIQKITERFARWPKVHIIAHSMGGLDARWMIYKHNFPQRIASLTTIGTPHHGSPEAERRLKRFRWVLGLAGAVGLDVSGALDLTPSACEARNRLLEPFEKTNGVIYRTVAGAQEAEDILFVARSSYRFLKEKEGDNDGLVSVSSAMWKEQYFMGTIDADHLNQIGWWDGGRAMGANTRSAFEKKIKEFYLDLAGTLSEIE